MPNLQEIHSGKSSKDQLSLLDQLTEIDDDDIAYLIKLVNAGRNNNLKAKAISTLARFQVEAALPVLSKLCSTQGVHIYLRKQAIKSLSHFSPQKIETSLEGLLKAREREEILNNTIDSIKKVGDAALYELLFKYLDHQPDGIKARIIKEFALAHNILSKAFKDEVSNTLKELAKNSKNESIIKASLGALAKFGSQNSPYLFEHFKREANKKICKRCIAFLGMHLEDNYSIAKLIEILLDRDPYFQSAAAHQLKHYPDWQGKAKRLNEEISVQPIHISHVSPKLIRLAVTNDDHQTARSYAKLLINDSASKKGRVLEVYGALIISCVNESVSEAGDLINEVEDLDTSLNGKLNDLRIQIGGKSALNNLLNDMNNEQSSQYFPLIMKGGGIKGLSYVGAIRELQNHFEFNWFVGTSAGAIAAILLGAGYTVDELEKILSEKNFKDFFDANWYKVPTNLAFHKGFYKALTFTKWIDDLLAEKLDSPTQVKLSDLPNRVTTYASRRGKKALIFDSADPAMNHNYASYAVRCSMSIPLIFTPQRQSGLRVFDGGMQNNYPVEILLEKHPRTQFIGLYLGNEHFKGKAKESSLFSELISIWSESMDIEALEKHKDRTIIINPFPIGTIDFGLTLKEKHFLVSAGRIAALKYLIKNGKLDSREVEFETQKDNLEEIKDEILRKRKKSKRIRWAIFFFVVIITSLIIANTRYNWF